MKRALGIRPNRFCRRRVLPIAIEDNDKRSRRERFFIESSKAACEEDETDLIRLLWLDVPVRVSLWGIEGHWIAPKLQHCQEIHYTSLRNLRTVFYRRRKLEGIRVSGRISPIVSPSESRPSLVNEEARVLASF